MKRARVWLPAVLAAVLVVLGVGVAQSQAQSDHGNTRPTVAQKVVGDTFCTVAPTCTQYLAFDSAFDTHIYNVLMGVGATRLTVDTQDCCITNDHWGVVVNKFGGVALGASNPVAAACGNGSTTTFSGPASLTGAAYSGKVIQVVVTHCSGVSEFPAGLYVRFTSDKPIQKVTQKSGLGG